MQIILGAYSQMPFATSTEELETLLARLLKPLLTMVYQHQEYKLLLHLSTYEIEWLESNHPEINMLIADLCRKGKLELLTSPYHDVVLPLLPPHERPSQIEKTTTFIRKRFSKRPKGLWCFNQIWSPSVIASMSLCSLDYVVISPYNQQTKAIICEKPFNMNEFGKWKPILPTDDRYSKEIWEFFTQKLPLSKLLSNIEHLEPVYSNPINLIMINLDQIVWCDNSSSVLEKILAKYGNKSSLPSEIDFSEVLSRTCYQPFGIYGRDFNIGNFTSINEVILSNRVLKRNFSCLNFIREVVRATKKNSDDRKRMESLLNKASNCSSYIPGINSNPNYKRYSSHFLCEIEGKIPSIPQEADIDGDMNPEVIVPGKNFISHLNRRGGVVTRLNIQNYSFDLALLSEEGIFCDSFVNNLSSKELSLVNKKYNITVGDKKRLDFFASCNDVDMAKTTVSVTKHFKFRQSTIVLDVEITNTGSVLLENISYQNTMNLSMPRPCKVLASERRQLSENQVLVSQNLSLSDEKKQISVSIALSEELAVSARDFCQNQQTYLGDKSFYHYTQIKILKKLSLKPGEKTNLTIGFRIDKRQEN